MASAITIQPMFAEISDKIPTIGGLWLMGLIVAGLVFGMFRYSRYTLLLSIPLAGLWLAGIIREFYGDKYFRTDVVAEMGSAYLHQVVFTAALPLIAAIFCGVLNLSSLATRQFRA
jgi:hypothetical protein